MRGFFLFIIALVSLVLIIILALFRGIWKGGFSFAKQATSLDQSINSIGGPILDWFWLKDKSKFNFGDMDKTISYNLGKNLKHKNLSKFGLFARWILHKLDANHVEDAYKNEI